MRIQNIRVILRCKPRRGTAFFQSLAFLVYFIIQKILVNREAWATIFQKSIAYLKYPFMHQKCIFRKKPPFSRIGNVINDFEMLKLK